MEEVHATEEVIAEVIEGEKIPTSEELEMQRRMALKLRNTHIPKSMRKGKSVSDMQEMRKIEMLKERA